jgi:glycosyltransferase involved in cell wall biosynthesis
MEERLRGRGLDEVPIHVVHNWADGAALQSRPFVRDGRLKVFYSGNMGLAHDFESVVSVIQDLDDGFLFRFSGAGPQRAAVAGGLHNVAFCEFRGYHGRDALEAAFAENDVGLVTQRAETVGTLVPSKVYGILAAGRGVLYVGPAHSTVARIIAEHGVGWQVANGDTVGLKRLLWQLRLNSQMVEETGKRARIVFEREFDKMGQVEKILRIIDGETVGADCSAPDASG